MATIQPGKSLRLKSTRPAESGLGMFQTFVSTRAADTRANSLSQAQGDDIPRHWSEECASIPIALSNSASSLLKLWIFQTEAVSEGADYPHVLGDWMECIPERIGHSIVLDTVIECFLTSTVAYLNPNADNSNAINRANARALSAVREAIPTSDSITSQDHLLLAVCLLLLVEVLQLRPWSSPAANT